MPYEKLLINPLEYDGDDINSWTVYEEDPRHSEDWLIDYTENQFNEVLVDNVLQRLYNPLAYMQALHRICAPGAIAVVHVPHGGCDAAWDDLGNIRAIYPTTFSSFARPTHWRTPWLDYDGDWDVESLTLSVSSHVAEEKSLEELIPQTMVYRNQVQRLTAILECVKPVRDHDRYFKAQGAIEIQRV